MNTSRPVTRLARVLGVPAIALMMFGLGCQTIMSAVTQATATPLPLPTPEPIPTDIVLPTPKPIPTEESGDTPNGDTVGEEFSVPDEGAFHIEFGESATYDHYPPSSGLHYGTYLEWGFYEDEVPPEFWVHSLEHGGIVFLYRCPADCSEMEAAIQSVIDNAPLDDIFNSKKILTSPNTKIGSAVVALAWTYQLNLDSVDEEAMIDFYLRHVNEGPELIP